MTRRALPLAASALLLSALFASVAGAQSETIEVTLVEVPVNVVDRNGEPVRGLKPQNFRVWDDGKERPITHFEEIDLATISTAAPHVVINPAARRNFLVVFDLSNSSPNSILRAREAAEKFLVETLHPRDLGAIGTYTVEEGFQILTGFTTDRVLLGYAARTLGNSRFFEKRDPLLLSGMIDQGLTGYDRLYSPNEIEYNVLEGIQLIQAQAERLNDVHRRARVERQLESFGQFARLLDSVRGRKQIILLSEGFDGRLIHGREDLGSEESQRDTLASLAGEIWRIDNDDRFGSVTATSTLERMGKLFRRSDVVLHAIDIKGLATVSDARGGFDRSRTNESLYLMADPTGGEVFRNSNDLASSFARLLKQQEVVYVLGFQSRSSNEPGRFHDLKVKVEVVDYPRLRVSHRAGYYEPTARRSIVEQTLSATDILMNDIPHDDVGIDTLAVPIPSQSGSAAVPVIVEISGADILERVKGSTVNAEIFIYAFDRSSSVQDFIVQTVTIDLEQLRESLGNSGLKYYGTLSLPPGHYSVKTLVRVAESGFNGFERVDLQVPASGEAALLPPLAVEEDGKWILLRGVSKAEGEIEYPFTLGAEGFIPSAMPRMKSSDTTKLALFTYNYEPDNVELTALVTGLDGVPKNARVSLVGRTSLTEEGAMKLLLDFEPEGLAPGEYRLDVTVREREGDQSSQGTLPFRVTG